MEDNEKKAKLEKIEKTESSQAEVEENTVGLSSANYKWSYKVSQGVDASALAELIDKARNTNKREYTSESVSVLNKSILNAQKTLCASVLLEQSVLQMAIAKVKVQREREKYERNKKEREDYIKTLETEIVNNRIEMENLKKNQNENMVVISTLEDQIRILKSKVFGFDIAKKYEFYKDHTNNRNNPISNIRDENLAYAMWEKENYNNKNVNKLEKIEDEKNLWIRDSKNNIDKLIKDVNSANKVDLNNIDNRNSFNNNNNGLMNSWSKKNYNNNYNNFNSDKNNSLGTHMRNYTPMILQNNNSYNNYNINGNGGNNNNNNGFNNKYNKF